MAAGSGIAERDELPTDPGGPGRVYRSSKIKGGGPLGKP